MQSVFVLYFNTNPCYRFGGDSFHPARECTPSTGSRLQDNQIILGNLKADMCFYNHMKCDNFYYEYVYTWIKSFHFFFFFFFFININKKQCKFVFCSLLISVAINALPEFLILNHLCFYPISVGNIYSSEKFISSSCQFLTCDPLILAFGTYYFSISW